MKKIKAYLYLWYFQTLVFLGDKLKLNFARNRVVKIMDRRTQVLNPLRNFRNVACPCGSGKKAKRCHGRDDKITMSEHIEILNMVREQMNHIANDVNKKIHG